MTEEKKTTASKSEARPLTEQERQRRKKMIVYPLMVLIFLGSMWLIFAPTGDKEEKGGDGFNTEMPDAAAGGIIGDKAKAYETTGRQEERRQEREMAIGDLGTLFTRTAPTERETASDTTDTTGNGDFSLTASEDGTPSDRKVKSTRKTIASSAEAYRDINRTLGSFYQPSEEAANEQLKSRISELEDKLASQTQAGTNTVDEQMALMERSYQLAAKYMPTAQNGDGQVQYAGAGEQTVSGQQGKKRKVSPVQQVTKTVVSALGGQCMDDEDSDGFTFQSFNTAVGSGGGVTRKNTISASVYGYQTVTDGQTVRLRMLEPMAVDERIIPKGAIIVGATKIQGERLCITITSIENGRMISPVELSVYDTDGQEGIFIPNSMEMSAAKEVAANMGGSMGSSINISSDAKAQLISDVGKGLIQGTSQYVAKKMRTIKVHLKAGYQVLLYQKEN